MTVQTYRTLSGFTQRPFNHKETMSVLRSNILKYMSWGISKFSILQNENKETTGLVLKVNGHHHKGYVLIVLGWDDTYQVIISSTHGNVKDHYENVYVDQLVDTIDNRIENIPEYTR